MGSLVIDCPYCGGKNSTFEVVAEAKSQAKAEHWYTLASCGACKEQVLLKLFSRNRDHWKGPMELSKSKPLSESFFWVEHHPSNVTSTIPEAIPDNVKRPLQEAEDCFRSGHYGASASSYRKAMERSIKHLDPDAKGMLYSRIRGLEKKGIFPQSLIELLDEVRLFGNSALHEDDEDPDKDDVSAAREFAQLFLTYAFSLPDKVEKAKKRREA